MMKDVLLKPSEIDIIKKQSLYFITKAATDFSLILTYTKNSKTYPNLALVLV